MKPKSLLEIADFYNGVLYNTLPVLFFLKGIAFKSNIQFITG